MTGPRSPSLTPASPSLKSSACVNRKGDEFACFVDVTHLPDSRSNRVGNSCFSDVDCSHTFGKIVDNIELRRDDNTTSFTMKSFLPSL